jgi:hypothetical protein
MIRRPDAGSAVLRAAAATVLVAGAVFAALLAADLRAWPPALERGEAIAVVSPRHASWTPSTHLGGLAGSMLGVGDDVALRHGIALYREVTGQREFLNNELDVESLRERAERVLGGPAASADPSIASQARTLLGILAFSASARGGGGASQADAAISDFTDAATLDPSNTAAKFNLELLLRLSAAEGSRRQSSAATGFGSTGRHAGAGGSPGSGY